MSCVFLRFHNSNAVSLVPHPYLRGWKSGYSMQAFQSENFHSTYRCKKQRAEYPKMGPYTSHVSKFSVFPSVPNRNIEVGT